MQKGDIFVRGEIISEKRSKVKSFINRKKEYPFYADCPYVSSVRELIDVCSARYGDKAAFRFREDGEIKSVTFRNFAKEVNALGTGLCEYGFAGEHIALIGENCYAWALAFYAALASDGVAVPVDSALDEAELEYIFNFSDTKVIIYSKSMEKKILSLKPRLPGVARYICMEEPETKNGAFFNLKTIKAKGKALLDQGDTRYTDIVPDPERLSELVFTSGTTGKAKGVMLNQRAICHVVSHSPDIMKVSGSCLSILPYYHTLESTCGLLGMFHSGNTNCINESLRALLPNFSAYQPTDVQVVPLFVEKLYRLVQNKIEEMGKTRQIAKAIRFSNWLLQWKIDIRRRLFRQIHQTFGGNLVTIICGGAPLAKEIAEFFYAIGITVCTGYGITECAPIITITRPEFHDYHSVGTILPGVTVKIENPDENGEGEICVKAPNVMLGYYKDEGQTKAAFDAEGFFHTGDIGAFYKDNRLRVTGRLKNVIILPNGKNVYPEELEHKIKKTSGLILEIVVREMERNGERVVGAEIFPDFAFAQTKGMDGDEIQAALKRTVAAYNDRAPNHKMIKAVKIRNTEFEKTASAKIKRSNLSQTSQSAV